MDYLSAEAVDQRFSWPLGRTARLARQRRLPHVLLPDGSIRFAWAEIESLVVGVGASSASATPAGQQPQEARDA